MGQVSTFIIKKFSVDLIPQSRFLSIQSKQKETIFLSPDLGHLGFRRWWGRWRCCGQETSWGLCQPYVPAGKPHGPGHRDNEKDQYKYQKCAPEQRKYFGVILQNKKFKLTLSWWVPTVVLSMACYGGRMLFHVIWCVKVMRSFYDRFFQQAISSKQGTVIYRGKFSRLSGHSQKKGKVLRGWS